MNTVEILKAGRELISDPSRWTQGTFARDADGDPCSIDDEDAEPVCWCILGAIEAVTGCHWFLTSGVASALADACGEFLPDFNDTHTHAEVLAMWDRAIANEEAKA